MNKDNIENDELPHPVSAPHELEDEIQVPKAEIEINQKEEIKESDLPQAVSSGSDVLNDEVTNKE